MVRSARASSFSVERARPEDYDRIAELTVRVYVDGGLVTPEYEAELTDVAGRADRAELLVVRDDEGQVVGSVALAIDDDFETATASGEEGAFRMLVVDPEHQGQGIGELLVTTCLECARAAGKRRMVLSTAQGMTAAHRLYERLGFTRAPDRDWTPLPGITLLIYTRDL